MTPEDPKKRTKAFALTALRLVSSFPPTVVCRRIGGQLVDSAGSVAANYRAACRARSRAEFLSRLGVVEEESDESGLWAELLAESGEQVPVNQLLALRDEANEITAMVVRSIQTARRNR